MRNPLLRFLYGIYAFTSFGLLLLIIFPAVLLATFFGQPLAGNFTLAASRWWADAWLFMIGISHRNMVEAPIEKDKSYVYVSNHISYLDIPLIFKAIRTNKLRVLGKEEMKKIPIFGVIYSLAVITVNRSSPEKRKKSVQKLIKMLNHHISIFVFPEGTFNETSDPLKFFYNGAFRVAIETGKPIKPVVFLDAKWLMHYSSIWNIRPGRSRAVILPEIQTAHLNLNELELLKEQTYQVMEAALLKYGKPDGR